MPLIVNIALSLNVTGSKQKEEKAYFSLIGLLPSNWTLGKLIILITIKPAI